MITATLLICLECYLYGKLSVPCTCSLAKEVQLFPCLGLYSGIFVIYLQCPSKESRTAFIIFYVLCLLYVLSTATVVCDLMIVINEVMNNFICARPAIFISYADACQYTAPTTSNWITANVQSPLDSPNHSNGLLWFYRPRYLGTHKSFYLSPFY